MTEGIRNYFHMVNYKILIGLAIMDTIQKGLNLFFHQWAYFKINALMLKCNNEREFFKREKNMVSTFLQPLPCTYITFQNHGHLCAQL